MHSIIYYGGATTELSFFSSDALHDFLDSVVKGVTSLQQVIDVELLLVQLLHPFLQVSQYLGVLLIISGLSLGLSLSAHVSKLMRISRSREDGDGGKDSGEFHVWVVGLSVVLNYNSGWVGGL